MLEPLPTQPAAQGHLCQEDSISCMVSTSRCTKREQLQAQGGRPLQAPAKQPSTDALALRLQRA